MSKKETIKELGDGLILRRATRADSQALVDFNASIHSDDGPDQPDKRIGAWVQDLATNPPPNFDVSDFTIVEDTQSGKIVSSLNLISQTWSYEGIEFGVGRPELVGTEPDYRRRGLVRAQFETIHQWSAERGHKVQAITGIPYYYRQFGYEMGLELGGGRIGYLPHIPKLKDDQEEKFAFRPAEESDIPFITKLDKKRIQRQLIGCVRDAAAWLYEIRGKSEENINRVEVCIITTKEGEPIGCLNYSPVLWGPTLPIFFYELEQGISWLDVTHSVLRYAKATGESYAAQDEDKEFQAFSMWMGSEHPVYNVINDRLPRQRDPYAWFVRVADLPDFLAHIQPVLEERLAKSSLVNHSGDLKLCFFRSGIKFCFQKGKIKTIEPYTPESAEDGDVLFPDLTFLRLLFGYNDFWELESNFADCYARNDHGRALTPILFPKKASSVWGIS